MNDQEYLNSLLLIEGANLQPHQTMIANTFLVMKRYQTSGTNQPIESLSAEDIIDIASRDNLLQQ